MARVYTSAGISVDIWESNKLAIFVAFVIPGFVALKFYELLSPDAARESSQQLIDAVAYSCVNYALLIWPIIEVESSGLRSTSSTLYAAFYAFVLLIAPVSWACLARWIRKTQFFQRVSPHPTRKPWDYVFAQRRSYWAIVTLKDGSRIGGKYGDRSFASSAPAAEQIYLEECWRLNEDGGFERRRETSAGILILANDMVTVEFFELLEGNENESKQEIEQRKSASHQGISTNPTTKPGGG